MLLIHGDADQQVALENALRLQAAGGGASNNVQLWVVPGADHLVFTGDGSGPENALYWQHVLAFLQQTTAAAALPREP